MKKILAMILCVVMVMSLATMAFAEESGSVALTTDSLGIAGAGYGAGETTVDGIGFGYTEIGDFGNGIQMRGYSFKRSCAP